MKRRLEAMKFQDTYPKVIDRAKDEAEANTCFQCIKENKLLFEAAIISQRNKFNQMKPAAPKTVLKKSVKRLRGHKILCTQN